MKQIVSSILKTVFKIIKAVLCVAGVMAVILFLEVTKNIIKDKENGDTNDSQEISIEVSGKIPVQQVEQENDNNKQHYATLQEASQHTEVFTEEGGEYDTQIEHIIAVFENILSFAMDLTGCSRKKAVAVNLMVIIILSMPCVLGFNVLSGLKLPGGSVLDFEDFLVSNNLLPLGSLVYLLFCTSRYGWGFKNFMAEANLGKGLHFPKWARFYVSYILPLIVLAIFVLGYISFF